MNKNEKYKVVIRDKFSHAIIESSDTIAGYDSWITASIKKEYMWKKYTGNKEAVYIEIIEVTK